MKMHRGRSSRLSQAVPPSAWPLGQMERRSSEKMRLLPLRSTHQRFISVATGSAHHQQPLQAQKPAGSGITTPAAQTRRGPAFREAATNVTGEGESTAASVLEALFGNYWSSPRGALRASSAVSVAAMYHCREDCSMGSTEQSIWISSPAAQQGTPTSRQQFFSPDEQEMEQFRHHDDHGDEDIHERTILCKNTRKRYEVLLQHVHAKLLRKALTPTQITTALTAVLRQPVLITRPFVVEGVAQLAARLVAMEKEKQRLVESGRGANPNGAAPASAHANFPEMPREQMLEPHHLACCLNTMAALGVWNDEFVRAAVRCLQRWNNIAPSHVVQCLVAVASLDGHLSAVLGGGPGGLGGKEVRGLDDVRMLSDLLQQALPKPHQAHQEVEGEDGIGSRQAHQSQPLKPKEVVDLAYVCALFTAKLRTQHADGSNERSDAEDVAGQHVNNLHERARACVVEAMTPVVVEATKRLLTQSASLDQGLFSGGEEVEESSLFSSLSMAPSTEAISPGAGSGRKIASVEGDFNVEEDEDPFLSCTSSTRTTSMSSLIQRELGMGQHDRFRLTVLWFGLVSVLPPQVRRALEDAPEVRCRGYAFLRRLVGAAGGASGSELLSQGMSRKWDERGGVEEMQRKIADLTGLDHLAGEKVDAVAKATPSNKFADATHGLLSVDGIDEVVDEAAATTGRTTRMLFDSVPVVEAAVGQPTISRRGKMRSKNISVVMSSCKRTTLTLIPGDAVLKAETVKRNLSQNEAYETREVLVVP